MLVKADVRIDNLFSIPLPPNGFIGTNLTLLLYGIALIGTVVLCKHAICTTSPKASAKASSSFTVGPHPTVVPLASV